MKKIILVRHGEITPKDDVSPRYLRTGQMFFHFTSKGLDCEWYTSTFNHFKKKQRAKKTFIEKINNKGSVFYIKSPGYRKNISIARLYDHFIWGIKVFLHVFRKRNEVDVIVTSIPTIFSTFLLVCLSKFIKVKVIVEIRDKWPDVFWISSYGFKKKIICFLSFPLKFMVKWSVENCDICTVSSLNFEPWLAEFINSNARHKIHLSFLGYKKESYDSIFLTETLKNMEMDAAGRKVIAFVGTIGYMFDLETVVRAAEMLDSNNDYFFAMFGNGDTIEYWRKQTESLTNIKFYGWVDKQQIDHLLKTSYIGLAPYIDNENFNGSVPNKIMEYTAYGLPILSTIKGFVENYLDTHRFGATYENGDSNSLICGIEKIREYKALDSEISIKMKLFYEDFFISDKIYDELLLRVEKIN